MSLIREEDTNECYSPSCAFLVEVAARGTLSLTRFSLERSLLSEPVSLGKPATEEDRAVDSKSPTI